MLARPISASARRGLLQDAKSNRGFVPDETKVLAQAVDARDGYGASSQRFVMTSLRLIEREVGLCQSTACFSRRQIS